LYDTGTLLLLPPRDRRAAVTYAVARGCGQIPRPAGNHLVRPTAALGEGSTRPRDDNGKNIEEIADPYGRSGTTITETVNRRRRRPVPLNGAVAMGRLR
jgi:hypothetical protein